MKKGLFLKILPHLIAFVVFLVIAVIYCRPSLEGQVLQQHDITSWKGSIQESELYKETHGHMPLWTNSLFGGMPTFQIGYDSNNIIPGIAHTIFTLGLPAPIQFFFLACICFYFLCIVLRINPYVGIMASLAFAYATYNPVIISVGHATKMWTIAYMPALLGSLLLIYERKYWLGAALTALFTSVMIAMNHPQIAYYFFIAVAIMTIFYIVYWIQAKQFRHMAMALGFTAVAAVVGLLTNAVNIFSTYEYQKETIRGGSTVLTDSTTGNKEKTKTGLDRDYAFSYSLAVPETFVMMVPRMYGGSGDKEEISQDKSKAIEALRAMPQELQQQLPMMYYWGGIKDLGGFTYTSGPPYIGAIICFLAILSFFVIDRKYKWWALTAIVFTTMMSWGYYFKGLNYFLFDNFPLYNKFRAPSMALVIPQLLIPMLAALGLNAYVNASDKKALWPAFKKGLIATAVVFGILLLLYLSLDYMTDGDNDLLKRAKESGQPQLVEAIRNFFDGLKADRKSLFMGDILRSLGLILVAALSIYFVVKNKLKGIWAAAIITVFVLIDLISIDSKYLNKDNYQDQMENEASFSKTALDDAILADTSFYRVFNLAGGAYQENITSYHYNSIGGYHPAKLRIYQDLINKRISAEQNALMQSLQSGKDSLTAINTPALNMLNAKYFIYKDGNETKAQWRNTNALGNCWFVNDIRFVKNEDEEIDAIAKVDLRTTALVEEKYKSLIPFMPVADSSASIQLVKNDNDVINYTSNSTGNQFAVFSEVYYKAGWNAFIDGKEVPIVRTNYALRGLPVPAGKHNIEFRFEPKAYKTGKGLTSVFSIILLALIALGFFMEYRRRKNPLVVVK